MMMLLLQIPFLSPFSGTCPAFCGPLKCMENKTLGGLIVQNSIKARRKKKKPKPQALMCLSLGDGNE